MPKRQHASDFKLGSIRYIHDPDAAQEWFRYYVQLVKEELSRNDSNSFTAPHTMETGQQEKG